MTDPTVWSVFQRRWRDTSNRKSFFAALREVGADFWEFLRESTPERKRLRYGDVEYDWEHKVDTTSATVTHRGRLIAAISGAPYQPTEPGIFRKMIETLDIDLRDFTFVDLGSGKGRTLLMASEFPFHRIVGVELLPELHEIAQKNVSAFNDEKQRCREIELLCCDAREYQFPAEPIVLYLFNPLPAAALQAVIGDLERSLQQNPRPARLIYHNALWEYILAKTGVFHKLDGTFQYSIYSN